MVVKYSMTLCLLEITFIYKFVLPNAFLRKCLVTAAWIMLTGKVFPVKEVLCTFWSCMEVKGKLRVDGGCIKRGTLRLETGVSILIPACG